MAFVFVKLIVVEAVIVVCAAGVPVILASPLLPVTRQPALILESALHVPEPSVRVIALPLVALGVSVTL